ncbi:MAG: cupin domain-containing protein [Sulfurimonas sp.]|nr:cupin domain-containing protein [Sulfurimonas sp.]
MKSIHPYWNPLDIQSSRQREDVEGSDGNLQQLTLAQDFGVKSHAYSEEIFVVSGRLYDEAFGIWLEQGHYASRPPYEEHGPFTADGEVIILEISYPSQS